MHRGRQALRCANLAMTVEEGHCDCDYPALREPGPSIEGLPPILIGHATSEAHVRVQSFYSSVAAIFETWVARRESRHTRRAYRQDVICARLLWASLPLGWRPWAGPTHSPKCRFFCPSPASMRSASVGKRLATREGLTPRCHFRPLPGRGRRFGRSLSPHARSCQAGHFVPHGTLTPIREPQRRSLSRGCDNRWLPSTFADQMNPGDTR
jgi:hypothetical protein